MDFQEDKHREFIEQPIGSLLWRYSSTMVMGFVAAAAYGLIDSVFVGKFVGEAALAGVSASFPIMLFQAAFGLMVNTGTSTLASIRMGEKNMDEAECLMGRGLFLSAFLGVLFVLVARLTLVDIFSFLDVKDLVYSNAYDFTIMMLWGTPFMFVSWCLGAMIRNDGSPKFTLVTMLVCIILNTILNPIFIIVFKMGVVGSALASVLSDVLTMLVRAGYFFSGKNKLLIRFNYIVFDLKRSLAIMNNGMASFLEQSLASLLFLVMNALLMRYGGDKALACGGIVERLSTFMYLPVVGISLGIQPIIGYNYGAKNYVRLKKVLYYSMFIAVVISTVTCIVVNIWAHAIMGFFVDDSETIKIGVVGLNLSTLAIPIVGFAIIGSEFFPAIGKARIGAFLSFFRQIICHIPVAILLAHLYGITGIWFSWVVSDSLAVVATAFLLWRELKYL